MGMAMSSSGTAVLLEFDTLHSLENDKRSTHYNDRHRLCTFKCNLYKVTALLMPEISLSFHQTRSNCQQSSKET